MADITVKQGEAKTVTLTITDSSGAAVDVSAATLAFTMKANEYETTALVSKADSDFGKAQAASGIVTFVLTSTDTDQTEGDYVGELKITFSATNIDKSTTIDITINKAVN